MSQPRANTALFETMSIPRAVAQLSIPMVLSNLVTIIYNLADTYFVGMLNDPIQNAAVTLVYPVMLAFYAVNNLFGVGTSSMMSRSLGAGNYERTRNSSVFGFYGALFSGVAFSLLCAIFFNPLMHILGADSTTWRATGEYMFYTVILGAAPTILNVVQSQIVRSEGSSVHASVGTMLGCVLNILLDPIFILPWGLNMGAAGAGLATCISNTIACLYFLILAWAKRGRTFVCLDIRRLWHLEPSMIRGILIVGVPASIQNLLNVTGSTILNNFTAAYGATAVAAMGIAMKVNQIPFQISMGFGQGIMPLVSYSYASQNFKRMKKSILFSLSIIVPSMIAVTAFYWIFSANLMGVFIANDEIIRFGTTFLHGMCLGIVFICIDFLGVGVFQALGMGITALFFALLRKVILEIPLMIALNHFFQANGLAYAQSLAEMGVATATVCVLLHIFRKTERMAHQAQAAEAME